MGHSTLKKQLTSQSTSWKLRRNSLSNDEQRILKLDALYDKVKSQISYFQSGALGLFPLSTSGKTRDAHIRDNVYSAMTLWGVSLALRHVDDDQGRTHEMEQSAVKCMRGLLFCLMRQGHKVEKFKTNQEWHNCLHPRFDVFTGTALHGDDEKRNLQVDTISLFILALVQMIASGLKIIFTSDEVNFIQNLVYYIERTYRTADFGIWERGSRHNDGSAELHASTIGIAKAALEAVNGFNLYGSQGTSLSVIYVDPDAHNRNSSILDRLLPRESSTKEIDSSLLTITGYPAFAVTDQGVRKEVTEEIISILGGNYGIKRFLRDGFGTILEEDSNLYYKRCDLKMFHGIECEWPMALVYLALQAFFDGDFDEGSRYLALVDDLLVETSIGKVIPRYYYVPKESMNEEKKSPGTVLRLPEETDDIFLWGQSLYILATMLADGLVSPSEIDPLGRRIRGKNRTKFGFVNHRYSTFESCGDDLVLQVSLISESRSLQATLATYGIATQTLKEIEPITMCQPSALVEAYKQLGVNSKLNLCGRPTRPLGPLGTSKIYRVLGKTVVTYPILLDEKDFYMSLDMSLVIDNLKSCLYFIRHNWSMRGKPTVCLFLRDLNFRGTHFSEMVQVMASLKQGNIDGVKVRLGRLQSFITTACVEHLDFLNPDDGFAIKGIVDEEEQSPAPPVHSASSFGFKSIYDKTIYEGFDPTSDDENSNIHNDLSTEELVSRLQKTSSLRGQIRLLHRIVKISGKSETIAHHSVSEAIEEVYRKACYLRHWSVVRYGASLIGKLVDSLAPSITTLLVSGRQVTIGIFGHEEHVISAPLTPAAIEKIIYSTCLPHDAREAALQQEMVIHLASIASTRRNLLDGMLKVRIGWIIQAMKHQLTVSVSDAEESKPVSIYSLSPSAIKQLLIAVLSGGGRCLDFEIKVRNWLQKRQLEGALNRVPQLLYSQVWYILERVPSGLRVGKHYIPQLPTLNEMTVDEVQFSLMVEDMLSDVRQPEYRQLAVELLGVVSTILKRNPEIEIQQCIDIDELICEALKLFNQDPQNGHMDPHEFYNASPTERNGTMTYFARAVVNKLLQGAVLVNPDDYCTIS